MKQDWLAKKLLNNSAFILSNTPILMKRWWDAEDQMDILHRI